MSQTLSEPVPAARDPLIDATRAGGVVLVVASHWSISETRWTRDGYLGITTAQTQVPLLSLASWFTVATPLIFFAGGWANARSLGVRLSRREYLRRRGRRLLVPVIPLAVFWLGVETALHLARPDRTRIFLGVSPRNLMPFGPLWFLPVYLMLVAAAPVTYRLHQRYAWWCPAVLIGTVATVDALRLVVHVPDVGWVNLLLVWALPYQLGYFKADGLLAPRSRAVLLFPLGIASLVLLTTIGPYPQSVGGVPGDRFSNMAPPTLALVALASAQVGFLVTVEPALLRLLERRPVRAAVDRMTRVSMTVFLWHMTALCMFLVLARMARLSVAERPMTGSDWLRQRPALFLGSTVVLTVIGLVVGRFEDAGRASPVRSRAGDPARLRAARRPRLSGAPERR